LPGSAIGACAVALPPAAGAACVLADALADAPAGGWYLLENGAGVLNMYQTTAAAVSTPM